VTYKQHRSSLTFAHVLHFANGILLKFCVTDGEDFVDDKYFGV
jgi:hypothetical protein